MSSLINQARSRVPRVADAAVERARLTVVPRARARVSRFPFVALVSVLLVGGVAGLLYFNTSMQQAAFRATALQQEATTLDAQRQALRLDLQREGNTQNLAQKARRLGMVPSAGPAFLRLSDGRVLGDRAPAVAGSGFRVNNLPTVKPLDLRPGVVVVRPHGAARPQTASHQSQSAHSPQKTQASRH